MHSVASHLGLHDLSIYVPRPKVIELFSCSTQLSMKLILLMYYNRINTIKQEKVLIFQYFSFYVQLTFHANLVEHEKVL